MLQLLLVHLLAGCASADLPLDVSSRATPFRCATYDKDAAKCARAHVGKQPCEMRDGKCRVKGFQSSSHAARPPAMLPAALPSPPSVSAPSPSSVAHKGKRRPHAPPPVPLLRTDQEQPAPGRQTAATWTPAPASAEAASPPAPSAAVDLPHVSPRPREHKAAAVKAIGDPAPPSASPPPCNFVCRLFG